MSEHPRMRREKKTIRAMMDIYCADMHADGGKAGLCDECAEMLEFALKRLDKCRYQEKKPTCGNCPAHCYPKDRLRHMEDIMRHSGPRMSWRHPIMALWHFRDSFRGVPERGKG